ncbi:MAG: aromatic amino acid lyase, partial [Bryobacteraceae bacterium]
MLQLDGESLRLDQVLSVARGREEAHLSPHAAARMDRSRALVDSLARGADPVYGVNTGFGLLADKRIDLAELEHLQRNIVRSHAAGVGDPLPRDIVRAMMLIRANVLAKGFSGIRPAVAEMICRLLNAGITPVVPSKGSVGASGDLAPLAHMALVLIGEGEADYNNQRLPGA